MKQFKKLQKAGALLLACVFIFCFASCAGTNEGEYPVQLANVRFDEKPTSVVCLSDSIADILIACGYSDMITAKSEECTQEELEDVPTVGSKTNPSVKKITDMSPAVVFTDKSVAQDAVQKLKNNDLKVLNMISASNSDELSILYQNISAVMEGSTTGKQNGEKKAKSILVTMDDLQRVIPETATIPTACYLYDIKGKVASDRSFCGHLFSYANTVNVCSEDGGGQAIIDTIKISNPQYIFCDKGVKSQIENSDDFKNLKAVKTGDVYEISSNLFERQGGSITQVLSFLIETIYPEAQQSQTSENSQTQPSRSEESQAESSQPQPSKPDESQTASGQVSEQSKTESSVKITAEDTSWITEDMTFYWGLEDDNIPRIQKRLKLLGYYGEDFTDADITNYFGDMTINAYMEFERVNQLPEDNYADANDLRVLFSDKAKPKPSETQETAQPEE